MKNNTLYFTFLLLFYFFISCDDKKNDSDDDYNLPYLRLQIVTYDSIAHKGIVGVFVGIRKNLNDTSIISNDSLIQDSHYYLDYGYTGTYGNGIFIFQNNPPPTDVYERMVAYFQGYKIWIFNRSKDTVINESSRNVKVIIPLSKK